MFTAWLRLFRAASSIEIVHESVCSVLVVPRRREWG
jgi:hypothetical protein